MPPRARACPPLRSGRRARLPLQVHEPGDGKSAGVSGLTTTQRAHVLAPREAGPERAGLHHARDLVSSALLALAPGRERLPTHLGQSSSTASTHPPVIGQSPGTSQRPGRSPHRVFRAAHLQQPDAKRSLLRDVGVVDPGDLTYHDGSVTLHERVTLEAHAQT